MKIRIAELNVEIFNRYPLVAALCRDYLCAFDKADIRVEASEEEIRAEMARAKEEVTSAEAEIACIYRAIARALPEFDAFVLHGAALACDGRAFVFSAPSGTGKSTHAALWLQRFGERVRILNGDKPILRLVQGELTVFGTPFCGKERWNVNASAPLAGLCFLERSERNSIAPLQDAQVLPRLFPQILMPDTDTRIERFLQLLDRTLQAVPAYLLRCNMEPEAAEVAYLGMWKE